MLDPKNQKRMLDWLEKQKDQKPAEEIKDQRKIYFMIEDGRRCGEIEGRKQVIDNPEKYGLQKPAEWSEKDERMIANIIYHLEQNLTPICARTYVDWLKSLRPQPHWKPSEEQMRCFDMVLCDEAMDENVHSVLVQLREQLKKLM